MAEKTPKKPALRIPSYPGPRDNTLARAIRILVVPKPQEKIDQEPWHEEECDHDGSD